MSNENPEQPKNKQKQPEFRAFIYEKQEDGKEKAIPVGAVWSHEKGGGLNVVLDDGTRYTLFPIKK